MDTTVQSQQAAITTATAPLATVPMTAAQPEQLHRVNLQDFLVRQVGKFVGIDFVKKGGCNRSLNGRLGVQKHLRGGTNTVEAQDRPYITLFDMKNSGYRAVNLATVSRVRANGKEFAVVG